MEEQRTILYCILDWGLGHATRSIPIISFLKQSNQTVIVASSQSVNNFIRKTFSNLEFIDLPAYEPTYSQNSILLGLIKDLPRLRKVYSTEKHLVSEIVKQRKVQLIISDNRFGCYNDLVPSIYITHQTEFVLQGLWRMFAFIPRIVHQKLAQNFNQCWVPDSNDGHSLSGNLGLRFKDAHFIGPLSQLAPNKKTANPKQLLILLSGPEPHRSILEQTIIKLPIDANRSVVLVRGVLNHSQIKVPGGWQLYQNCSRDELNVLMDNASLVICRSGYSSIMDLVRKQKSAILIPTPGQPEQNYLAKYVKRKGWFYSTSQNTLSKIDLNSASDGYSPPNNCDFEAHKKSINTLLNSM